MKDNGGSILAGLIIGAAAGLVAGVLIAPDKGEETRDKLNKKAKKYKKDLDKYAEELGEKAKNVKSDVEQKIKERQEKFTRQTKDITQA